MKDLVENRKRISFGKKIRLVTEIIRQNGVRWSGCLGGYYVASAIAHRAFETMDRLRKKHDLPGVNSASLNKLIWESWDWQAQGEEWTPSPEWKQSVVDRVLRPHMPEGGLIVEIGPGGGRWTDELRKLASKLVAVDISEECLRVCRERFADSDNIEWLLTPGNELPGVETGSTDAIWSFDVFVHINRTDVEGYASELQRVLKPGGIGVLHHGTTGGASGGWRSNMTAESMSEVLENAGLQVTKQFTTWKDGEQEYQAGLYEDAITVFRKP